MDPTGELILRQGDAIGPGVLLVCPSDPALLPELAAGSFLSLHYGQWQSLSRVAGWQGLFGLDQNLEQQTDHAVLWMPKARQELPLLLAWARQQLRPDGTVWLVGPKKGGVESGGKTLRKLIGNGGKRDSARHCQLWEFHLNETAEGFELESWATTRSETVVLGDATVELILGELPGIFSAGRIDAGTAMLLQTLEEQPRSPVLDFACGTGVIAAALKRRWPELELNLLDVQWQALEASRRTLAVNGLEAQVFPGDGLGEVQGRFGMIITNPPFHTGLRTDLDIARQFIRQARRHIHPRGELRLVANAFLPYRELLDDHFTRVEVLAEDNRFRVYRATA